MRRLRLAACALLVLPFHPLAAQYQNHAQLTASLRQLAARPGTELVTIATSPGGRAVQALRVGAAGRPALLVIANAHGPHLVGSSIALAAAEQLRTGSGDSVTVWFIPRLNPDAAEGMFASVPWARTANEQAWDDDRDQRDDEDGFDDLNGDGVIGQLRLADPNGAWIADSADPRLMRRADAAKGEVGRWTVESEGRDDDADGEYNEDGPGGTDVNRNFGYDYPHHGREAGRDPFATPEARGLAEFLMAHDEIAAVYVIGPQDNILRPWENRPNAGVMNPETRERAQEGTSAGGPLNSILRADQSTFADVGRRFQAITGLTKAPPTAALGGDVLSWAYFHFGRWSFGSRGWWVPDAPRDTTQRAGGAAPRGGASGGGSSGGNTDPLADERNALRWFESQGIDVFVPWTGVTLGGRERRTAEVGGFRPGALLNPPAGAQLDSTLARQSRFIGALAGMLPKLAIHDARAERLGDGVYRVTVELANRGALPTTTSLAGRLRQPRRVRLDLDLGEATLLSGQKVQQLGAIEGGGRTTSVQWTVAARAGSTVRVAAGSPVTGTVSQSITLR
jgi:hypothetical protein